MKIIKYPKIFLLLIMVLPWMTIPLLKNRDLKRFLPTALFSVWMVQRVNVMAKKRKWWWWYVQLIPNATGVIPFMWGPFFVGSLWILKWTFGKLNQYIMINFGAHFLFTYIVVPYLTKFGLASLVRMKKIQLMLVFTVLDSLLYIFQIIREKLIPLDDGVKDLKPISLEE
ncbi:hypothetical protein [Bacillus sp. T3]|uniref:hypothetical protein n=1 Tax=Bacillus sp. T3 TaxID=467262 RepID=UPI0029824663|nr:hypothetical protein [Bacillus sp. T3]